MQQNNYQQEEGLLITIVVATIASGRSLVEICKPYLAKISQNIESSNPKEILVNLLDLQTIYYEAHASNKTTHQLDLVFEELWPLFKRLFDKYSVNTIHPP